MKNINEEIAKYLFQKQSFIRETWVDINENAGKEGLCIRARMGEMWDGTILTCVRMINQTNHLFDYIEEIPTIRVGADIFRLYFR